MPAPDEPITVPDLEIVGEATCPECGGDGFVTLIGSAPGADKIVGEICAWCSGTSFVSAVILKGWREANPERHPRG